MSFEVNTGTAASALDGTEKIPVSQGALPRVVTAARFPYLNSAGVIFTDKTVNIDTGAGGSLILGDYATVAGLIISVTDGAEALIQPGSGVTLRTQSDGGSIANSGGSVTYFSWSSAAGGCTARFAPSTSTTGLRLYDADGSHTLNIAVGSNLTSTRTLTLTTGNANRTLDMSIGDITFSIDGTLAGNSDAIVPTQKAVKTYVDGIVAANDAMVFKGVIDCSANPNYPAADRGHTYRVSVAGKIGGASGTDVEAGDILICLTDGTASGTQAGVGASWGIIQTNLILAAGIATFLAAPTSANLAAAVTDETGSGALVFGTSPTLATPVINGLPTGTGVSSTNVVSTLLSRDANGNTQANNFVGGFTTTATAAGTTTLTITATRTQVFTGTTTQTVKLPTTSVLQGQQYQIINQSTGAVTVQSSGANTIAVLAPGTSGLFTAVVATPTTAANWDCQSAQPYDADLDAVASSGVAGAWATTTPTPTAQTGSLTSASSSIRAMKIGKTVFFSATVVITTNGTGASWINVALPYSSVNSGNKQAAAGHNPATGGALQGVIFSNSTTLAILERDGTYPGADGRTLCVTGCYEAA